ncbi:plasmid mobilization relaxosome protein MobC [Achromobacter spanius]|uniref:plasmid mobilization relaxosome protein MobC n=1 Tax=Achromobacter spanius TaxID=217203 RepID=UPI0037F570BE
MSKHAIGKLETLRARVPTALKEAFDALAAQRGVTPSELLREVVTKELSSDADATLPPLTTGKTARRLMVRLPQGVANALHIQATLKGMASSRYLGALAQAHLTLLPVLDPEALKELRAATRELAAVGRNLNQIARALNDSHHETDRLRLEAVNELFDTIEAERQAIRALVQANLANWGAVSDGEE